MSPCCSCDRNSRCRSCACVKAIRPCSNSATLVTSLPECSSRSLSNLKWPYTWHRPDQISTSPVPSCIIQNEHPRPLELTHFLRILQKKLLRLQWRWPQLIYHPSLQWQHPSSCGVSPWMVRLSRMQLPVRMLRLYIRDTIVSLCHQGKQELPL